MKMSSQAKKLCERVPTEIRIRLLNNVYCVSCKGTAGIAHVRGAAEKGNLILRGICTKCGGEVARLVESD